MYIFWINNMGMFTSSLSKMTASYLLLLVLRHLGLPPHTLPPQPNLIWWSYHIFYREIKSKQKDSVFFTSSKLLTLSISTLFPAYHFTLWIRNPCSCQRPDFPTNPTVFGFHFQDFISTIFSFSCIINVMNCLQHHTLSCSSMFYLQKTLLWSQILLILQLTERLVSSSLLQVFTSHSLSPIRPEYPLPHWYCF